MKLPISAAVLSAIAATFCFSQNTSDPWQKNELLETAPFAHELQTTKKQPIIISVAFPNLYHANHILHAIDAGPGSKPEGIEALKKAVANVPKDADIVVYCGCCPMVKCPNIRPAYRTLKELGFTHVRVLSVPTNMHDDWYTKGYPSENPTNSGD
jgi:rhodanese-related sulfurtransferase